MISASENTAVASAELPLLGGSDRQAAHYYRAQHARALQREERFQQRAQAAEKIIVQLQVLIGWLLQQIRDLQRQLAWLKKQQFGRKSESRPNPGAEVSASPPARPAPRAPRPSPKRRRGQQPGAKGPQRRVRADLPEQIIHHTLEPSQLVCPCCGKVRPELSLREQSQEIGWEVRLVRRRHVRFRYGPSCQCPPRPGHPSRRPNPPS